MKTEQLAVLFRYRALAVAIQAGDDSIDYAVARGISDELNHIAHALEELSAKPSLFRKLLEGLAKHRAGTLFYEAFRGLGFAFLLFVSACSPIGLIAGALDALSGAVEINGAVQDFERRQKCENEGIEGEDKIQLCVWHKEAQAAGRVP
jgi:hypothetical protein